MILLTICSISVNAQNKIAKQSDTIGNIVIRPTSDSLFCLFLASIDTAYKGKEKYSYRNLRSDSLQPELNNYVSIVNKNYVANNDTIELIQYQNISQSGTSYERFWVITKKTELELKLEDLSEELQESICLFGNKLILNIKKGFYYEN